MINSRDLFRAALVVCATFALTPSLAAAVGPPQPKGVQLSDSGDVFGNYDQKRGKTVTSDWPVALILLDSTVDEVKDETESWGYDAPAAFGGPMKLGYRKGGTGGTLKFDIDKGRKTGCNSKALDWHYRIYGAEGSDYFADRDWGHYTVATTHYDIGDSKLGLPPSCAGRPKRYGNTDRAELEFARRAKSHGHTVWPNYKPLNNRIYLGAYNKGSEVRVYRNDGKATVVKLRH